MFASYAKFFIYYYLFNTSFHIVYSVRFFITNLQHEPFFDHRPMDINQINFLLNKLNRISDILSADNKTDHKKKSST